MAVKIVLQVQDQCVPDRMTIFLDSIFFSVPGHRCICIPTVTSSLGLVVGAVIEARRFLCKVNQSFTSVYCCAAPSSYIQVLSWMPGISCSATQQLKLFLFQFLRTKLDFLTQLKVLGNVGSLGLQMNSSVFKALGSCRGNPNKSKGCSHCQSAD